MHSDRVRLNARVFIFLSVLILGAYWPSFQLPFIQDDHSLIEKNSSLLNRSMESFIGDFKRNVFTHESTPYYRPLMTTTFRIDRHLWGLRAGAYRVTNFLFHISACFFIYLLVLQLGAPWLSALLVAGSQAIHPLFADLFLQVSIRDEPMAFTFMLGSILCLLRNKPKFYWAALGLYGIALLCKEIAIVTPLLGLLAYWYTANHWPKSRLWWIGIVAITGLYLGLRLYLFGQVGLAVPLPWVLKFLFVGFPQVLMHYISYAFWPWNLYCPLTITIEPDWIWRAATVLGAISISFLRSRRLAIFAWGWGIIALLPAFPLYMQGSAMAHWAYPAGLALFFPLAMAFTSNGARYLWGVLFVAWMSLIHFYLTVRGSDEKTNRWNICFGEKPTSHFRLGVILLQTGRAAESITHLERAHHLLPKDAEASHALALAYWQTGQRDRAKKLLQETIRENPAHPEIRKSLDTLGKS